MALSLAKPSSEPTNDDKVKALDALLELRRLEQLKAIADGSGNSTYFFGDSKGTGRGSYDVDNVERWKRSLSEKSIAYSDAPSHKQPQTETDATALTSDMIQRYE